MWYAFNSIRLFIYTLNIQEGLLLQHNKIRHEFLTDAGMARGLRWFTLEKKKDKIKIEQVVHQVGYIYISYIKLGTIKLTFK